MMPSPIHTDTAAPADAPAPDNGRLAERNAERQRRQQTVGQRPGALNIRPDALPPRLFLVSYAETHHAETDYTGRYPDLVAALRAAPHLKHWVDVRGYGDLPLLQQLMKDFGIHPLQMEDVVGDFQRAKVEVFDDNRLFLVSRMTEFTDDLEIDDDQLSLFTGPNYVLSFQDDYDDCLGALRNRLRTNFSQLRRLPSAYLAYALTDVVLDHYYPTMAAIGDHIDDLEEAIFQSQRPPRLLSQILRLKKDVVRFRRLVYPERDKIAEILRLPDEIVPENIKVYYRDCYDHAIQALDMAESYRDNISSLTDLFLSDQSNRMNEVMKVLTIISSIFIPLSFVVGLYGMNFQREGPNGEVMPLNMPELYQPHGYMVLVGVLVTIVVGQMVYFYRKGWLSSQNS